MTLKYESEILFDLMKRDGDDTPSDVLPYESELKEKYLQQVVGAYPKLQDYRSEWLNYNLEADIPADFPVESVSNVTNATFENVVPYAYKSAILKGNTLVNNSSLNGEITLAPGSAQYIDSPFIKKNTTFTVSFNCSSAPTTEFIEFRQVFENTALQIENKPVVQGYNRFKVTTVSSEINRFRLKNDSTSETDFIFNNLMILEGDYTNVDIPYFEGMQSVKMPVLTTSNEDGTKTNILSTPQDLELRGIGDVQDTLDCFTGEVTERIGEINTSSLNESHFSAFVSEPSGLYRMVINVENLNTKGLIKCNKLPVVPLTGSWNLPYECIALHDKGILLYLKDTSSVESYVNKAIELDLIIQYGKVQNSVKTVDLTVTDQDGNTKSIIRPIEGTMHVSTSSQTLPPLLDMSVPVEATSQNLMSFANIKEEE